MLNWPLHARQFGMCWPKTGIADTSVAKEPAEKVIG